MPENKKDNKDMGQWGKEFPNRNQSFNYITTAATIKPIVAVIIL